MPTSACTTCQFVLGCGTQTTVVSENIQIPISAGNGMSCTVQAQAFLLTARYCILSGKINDISAGTFASTPGCIKPANEALSLSGPLHASLAQHSTHPSCGSHHDGPSAARPPSRPYSCMINRPATSMMGPAPLCAGSAPPPRPNVPTAIDVRPRARKVRASLLWPSQPLLRLLVLTDSRARRRGDLLPLLAVARPPRQRVAVDAGDEHAPRP